ncbi:serine-rich adhesin for platelets-like isoform X2 [Cebidichthys violaceus]|uniref:serine-rich adhesin for platelets-like isoform X2 n=1 Tax=Cebidichthys violaceus TaxID=271503 RepID=UPI0035CC8780
MQQDPGLHGTSRDPGLSSHPQHHVPARPFFYVHAQPPPPFLHYQWPMPYSYNPFAGFPGMGYGMVMPPFPPPPPYMEAPAYVLPHSHIQPVDYRRFLHPQVYAPSAPYQNPNQARRVHLSYTGPVRETVNSEVQTEPTRRGVGGYGEESPVVSTDSGRGTTSNSSSPSSSTSEKRSSAEVENYTLPSSDANDNRVKRTSANSTVKDCFDILQPTGTKTVQARIRATLERQQSRKDCVNHENIPPCGDAHYNVWSVSSADSIVPVCSSSQQEEVVVLERRVSVPDILMSWGDGKPQATTLTMADKLPQNDLGTEVKNDLGTEVKHDQSIYQRPTETTTGPVVADRAFTNDAEGNLSSRDSATLFKILKMRAAHVERKTGSRRENESMGLIWSVRHGPPYRDEHLHSLNDSNKLPDDEQENGNKTNPHEDTADIIPFQMSFNSGQMKRKMNESVWSVESLAPCIPTKEWLLQNGMFEPQVIVEMTEEAENGGLSTQNSPIVKAGKERKPTRSYSSSDSVLLSDSWLFFSTPAEKLSPPKKPETESEIDASEMSPKQGQNMGSSQKDSFASLTHLPPSKIVLSTAIEEDMDKNMSSEPEANLSPNQKLLIINEQQAETLLLNSAAGEKISSSGQLILQNRVDMEAEDDACGNKEVSQPRNKPLCAPIADLKTAEVSPSKGHLVDCGVQCTKLQERNCNCNETGSSVGPRRRKAKQPAGRLQRILWENPRWKWKVLAILSTDCTLQDSTWF